MKMFSILMCSLGLLVTQSIQASTFATEKWHTKNGVQVVFYPAMEVPMLDISLAFAAGSVYDGDTYGLSALTSHMMNQGNAGHNATEIAEAFGDTGAQFNIETSKDMVAFTLKTLNKPDALAQSITTFSQIINHPDFPDEAFMREKKQLLMSLKQAQESPDEIATLKFFKIIYGSHPYAHPVNGSTKTLNSLSKKQVLDFYKNYYVAANATLVLVGAVDSQTAHQIAEQITKELPKGIPAPVIPKAEPLTKAETKNISFPSSQTMIRLGQIGIDHQNPNYFPLVVGNYILGGGALTSRLSIEVREKRGLTYGVTSSFVPMPGEGPFLISLSTKNDQSATALKITEDTLHKFINDGPSQQELAAAKQYLTGSFPLSLGSNSSIASILLRMAFYHLPDDYLTNYVSNINAVTSEQIKQAFKQQVNPLKLSLVTVGRT